VSREGTAEVKRLTCPSRCRVDESRPVEVESLRIESALPRQYISERFAEISQFFVAAVRSFVAVELRLEEGTKSQLRLSNAANTTQRRHLLPPITPLSPCRDFTENPGLKHNR